MIFDGKEIRATGFYLYRGITENKPHEWQIGIFLLGLVAVAILCVKLFPKQFDSVESGEEGKKFLSHVAKKAAGRIDE